VTTVGNNYEYLKLLPLLYVHKSAQLFLLRIHSTDVWKFWVFDTQNKDSYRQSKTSNTTLGQISSGEPHYRLLIKVELYFSDILDGSLKLQSEFGKQQHILWELKKKVTFDQVQCPGHFFSLSAVLQLYLQYLMANVKAAVIHTS